MIEMGERGARTGEREDAQAAAAAAAGVIARRCSTRSTAPISGPWRISFIRLALRPPQAATLLQRPRRAGNA